MVVMMTRWWRSRSEQKMKGWPLMMMIMIDVRARAQAEVVVERNSGGEDDYDSGVGG